MSISRSWLFPSLAGCLVLSGLVACTVTTGPSTDNGPVKGDDDDDIFNSSSSSSSSSGSTSSSSSSGAPVDADAGSCTIEDVEELSEACQTCTISNCESATTACFCNANGGNGGTCADFLAAAEACFTEFTAEDEQTACVTDAQNNHAASYAAYDAYNTCQQNSCATECASN